MSDQRQGFEKPNHTQTPNSFFDSVMPQIKSIAELKVILAITRLTFGWQKQADRISMSQLQKLTGLTHQGVQNGIVQALEHGFIDRAATGQSFIYKLKVVNEIDQSTKLTSQRSRPKPVNEVDRKPVNEVDRPNKEKERKEKNREFWVSLKANPAYSHIDLENEIHKMKAWLSLPGNKGRQLTPKFILNWLNKIERPVDVPAKSNEQNRQSARRQQELAQKWGGQNVKSA